MTDKEKLDAIRAEIHRLVDVCGYPREMANALFTFMDSLPNDPKFKVGNIIKFKGVHNEDVIRVVTDIKESEGGGFRYFFADGSIHSIGDDEIELVEEPVSEEIWEASKQYALRQVLASTDTEMSEQAYLNLRLFSGFELAVAHKDGAEWYMQQLMKSVVLETEVLRDSDGDGVDTPYESWLTLANTEIPELPENLGLKEGDKVKILIVKSE